MVCYWRAKNTGEFDISKFPAFYHKHAIRIDNLDAFEGSIYGCPSFEYKGLVKVVYQVNSKTYNEYQTVHIYACEF